MRPREARGLAVFLLFLVLVCPMTSPAAAQSPSSILSPVAFADIAGWAEDDHAAALAAFQRSCTEILAEGKAFNRSVSFGGSREQWLPTCRAATDWKGEPRAFFEQFFKAFRVKDPARPEGLFTGYYEPEAEGSLVPSKTFRVPIYAKPDDLVAFDAKEQAQSGLSYGRIVDGKPSAYFTRKEIEQGALAGRKLEIVWLKDWVDAFFMHIQGSGRVRLTDGSLLRLAYAAKSGQPYTGIGKLLVERGAFPVEEMSMQATRAWMAKDEQAARELMWENHSFIFFRAVKVEDPALGPPGAQGALLTPRRSLAVDRSIWMFGTPIWLDTHFAEGQDAPMQTFRHLMVAQDTGTAIRGHVRGDIFWGAGETAALIAGHLKSPGRMIVLLPPDVALASGLRP